MTGKGNANAAAQKLALIRYLHDKGGNELINAEGGGGGWPTMTAKLPTEVPGGLSSFPN